MLAGCGGNSTSTESGAATEAKQLGRSEKAVVSPYQTVVQQLYVSYFGRPADPTGLTNFEAALAAANAPTDIQSLATAYSTNPAVAALIDSFGSSKESQTLYGTGNTTAFVTAIFNNVIGRQPQSAGLNFWVNAINSGSLSQGDAALAIMAGALTNTTSQGQLDAQLINNRIAVASAFTGQVASANLLSAYVGATSAATARTYLSGVNAATDVSSYEATANATLVAMNVGSYTADSLEASMFNLLNQVRINGGFGALTRNSLLDQSTLNHASYLYANYYSSTASPNWSQTMYTTDPSNGVLYAHLELAGNSGFTGEYPQDRAKYVGDADTFFGEVISFSPNCINELLDTVFHRSGLLGASYKNIGLAVKYSPNNQNTACVVDLGSSAAVTQPAGWVGVYPAQGQTAVPVGMFVGEAPDPAPSVPNANKGSPVSIYLASNLASVTSFTLTAAGASAPVPVVLITHADFPTYLSSAEAHILPTQRLAAATTYTANFSGVLANGATVTKSWSFTTAAANPLTILVSANSLDATNPTITATVSGGNGDFLSIQVGNGPYSYFGSDPKPVFETYTLLDPASATITRTNTGCTAGVLLNCQITLFASDSWGNQVSLAIPVH